MSYKFSEKSKKKLDTVHPYLQLIMNELIQIMDVTIIEGYRGKEKQDNYYQGMKSKLQYPNSKHNKEPSLAVDVAPYPIDWKNIKRFYFMNGIIKGIAHKLGISIRLGIDWDSDNDLDDSKFVDAPHVELNV